METLGAGVSRFKILSPNNKYLKRSRSPTDDGDPKIPKIRVISEIPKYSSQKSNDIFLCDKTKNVCDCHVSAVTSVPHTSALSADGDALMRDGLTPKTHLTPDTPHTSCTLSVYCLSSHTSRVTRRSRRTVHCAYFEVV